MADPALRKYLEERIGNRLLPFLPKGVGAPCSVQNLCRDLERVVQTGDPGIAFLGTCVCSILAELIAGSHDGGIFPSTKQRARARGNRDRWSAISTLLSLRNASFHPAAMSDSTGPRHVQLLAEKLAARNADLSMRLQINFSELRGVPMLKMAIALVDELGREEIPK